jgi:hypothetical protein
VRRAWHWLTGRATIRPRRITVAIWSLVWLFQPAVSRLLAYLLAGPWVLPVLVAALLAAAGVPLFWPRVSWWIRQQQKLK